MQNIIIKKKKKYALRKQSGSQVEQYCDRKSWAETKKHTLSHGEDVNL